MTDWILVDSVPAHALGHQDVIYHDGDYRFVEIVEDDVDSDIVSVTYEDEMGDDVVVEFHPFTDVELYAPDNSLTI